MRLSVVCVPLLFAALVHSKPEGSWKWGSSSDSTTTTAAPAVADESKTNVAIDVDAAADAILTSTRNGKLINTYEAVYEDQHVQEALQKGNDTEARTYIKEKLCNLGLAKECAKLYSKQYGFGHQIGIDPGAVSYVQPVAIVPAGAPIPAVPLGVGPGVGPGVGIGKHHGKGHAKSPAKGYGAPLSTGYGAPLSQGYGAPTFGLNSLSPPPLSPVALPPTLPAAPLSAPLPAALPPAPLQHVHHHYHEGNKIVAPPPPPPVPAYNLPPPPPIQPLRPTGYSNAPPPPPPRQPYASNPVPSYSNAYSDYSPRDACVCVPIEQCPSTDRIGRVVDYAIDPRTKSKSNATVIEADDDIVILNQPETTATPTARRRRQSIHHRQVIVGDDSVTVVSSEATPGTNPINQPISGVGPIAADDAESISVDAADAAPGVVGSNPIVGSPAAGSPGAVSGVDGGAALGGGTVGALGAGAAGAGTLLGSLKKFVQPTFGISFGLPGGAFGSGYPLNPLGNNPVVNPYGGAIGGDGVNFGSFNVNPLVSLQLGKSESGEKKFRPLFNLHITPSQEKLAGLGLGGPSAGGLNGLGNAGGFGNPGAFGGLGGLGGFPFRQGTDTQLTAETNRLASNGVRFEQAFFKSDSNENNDDSHSKIRDDDPWKLPSATSNSIRPLRQASYEGPRGEESLGGVAGAEQRSGYASASEPSFKHGFGYKAYEKAFGKGFGAYNFPVPVATPVAVPQPVGVPVAVPQPYNVPVAVPQPVPVAQPYAVPQPVPVKVPVVEHVPVRVPVVQHVPVQVPVHVPVRVEVPVKVEVPVPVAAPYPVPVPYEQPVQVHEHYHHHHQAAPHYLPPKASVYQPPVAHYGTPVPNYSGPVSPYAPSPVSSYGAPPHGYHQGAATAGYGYGHGHQAAAATGYNSLPVHATQPGGYTFRDSSSASASSESSSSASYSQTSGERRPKAVGSGVRFVDARSGEAEPTPPASSVRFETAKRKRSPKPQENNYEAREQQDSESVTVDEGREARQLGGNSLPTCSYNQVCCRTGATNRYTAGVAPGTCGRRNPQGITGRIKSLPQADGEAEFAEYPWQAAILKKDQYDNVYVCGGALVGPSHILTAAHCIKGLSPAELRVRLGEWDVNRESEFYPHVEKDVISVIIHPEYYPGNLYNDVALIKIEGSVDFAYNPHIAPACLPQRYQEFVGTRCWVTGWGKDSFGTGGRYQNILKEVDVPVVDNLSCENKLRRTRLGYDFKLHSGFLCAGGEEGKDACKGDGGGPLVCESQGSWFLAGLVSWGIGCGSPDVPGVYVKVSEYTDWVQRNLAF